MFLRYRAHVLTDRQPEKHNAFSYSYHRHGALKLFCTVKHNRSYIFLFLNVSLIVSHSCLLEQQIRCKTFTLTPPSYFYVLGGFNFTRHAVTPPVETRESVSTHSHASSGRTHSLYVFIHIKTHPLTTGDLNLILQ